MRQIHFHCPPWHAVHLVMVLIALFHCSSPSSPFLLGPQPAPHTWSRLLAHPCDNTHHHAAFSVILTVHIPLLSLSWLFLVGALGPYFHVCGLFWLFGRCRHQHSITLHYTSPATPFISYIPLFTLPLIICSPDVSSWCHFPPPNPLSSTTFFHPGTAY